MRHYEIVFLVHPDQSEQVPAMLERYKSMIATGSGSVHRLEDWGRRQLAYPIGRKENGYYVIARFDAETAGLPEYERAIRLDDSVIRHLITIHEHAVGAPPMTEEELALAKKRGDDDDDDEE